MLNFSSLFVLLRFHLFLLLLLNSLAPSFPASASGPHIADVNILLPPKMTHPVEYRLQGSDGCFKWSWDHHDILSVLPEYNASNHCSTSARLRSIAPYSGRKETAVYATDVRTGMVIRCKVYIDNFSKIKIFHNSIKLDLDGLATLRMRAFDDEDNVFSSLVGLQFMWQLVPEVDGMPHRLVHVPLKDSPMSDCGGLCGDLDIQINLEDDGVFSDLFVVKGIEIGHENVYVNLAEPHFEHLSDKIALTVAEAMSLEPSSPLFVLPDSTIHYCLKVICGGIPKVVTLPSLYHHWSVSNSSVASVDVMMGVVKAINLGITSVTVEDSRVIGHLQISSLHVVTPESIQLYLIPLSSSGDLIDGVKHIPSVSRWHVVSGRQYLIQMKVFSQGPDAQEIYLTESDDIKLQGEQSDFWSVRPVSNYPAVREWLLNSKPLLPLSFGLGKLMASLTHSKGNDEKETLKIVQEFMVCDEVKLSMDNRSNISPCILLPWAPSIYQELELKVTGGCGKVASDYKWFSSDVTVVSISTYGVLQAQRPGKAVIKVVSIIDQLNFDEVAIEVSVPYSMIMLPEFTVETIVGSHIEAAVTMKSVNGAFFDRCDAFNSAIKWKLEGESFKIMNSSRESIITSTLAGPPCAWANAYASSPGRVVLSAILSKGFQHFDGPLPENIMLKASSQIAAYTPLIVHQVGNGNQYGGYWFDLVEAEMENELENLKDLYLVPGTCLDVMLRGGPEPWDKHVDFIQSVEIFSDDSKSSDGVLLYQIPSNYGHQYRISCQKLGSFKIVFKRGNLVGVDHPKPAIEEASLLLSCSFPSTLVLIIDHAENTLDVILAASQAVRGSGRMRENPVTVANGRSIRMSAVGLSDSGEAFGNSSFLHLKWELSNCDGLASWDNTVDLTTSKFIWDKTLILHNESGMCTVRASATGYFDAISNHQFVLPFQRVKTNLTDAVYLQLVSNLRLDPAFSLMFFSPDALLNISVAGGSCFLKVLVNDSQVAEVIKPPSSLQCSQLVLAPKGLGTAIVSVKDIGLSPPLAASSVIEVADVDWIKITSPDELRLMEGGMQSIHVLAGIDSGRTFDTSQLAYMTMQIHFEDQIIELVDDDSFLGRMDEYANSRTFNVRAKQIGITNLYVSARQLSGRELLSQPIRVEVYTPPKILPSDIFLVPGASYTLTVKGGPIFAAYIVYDSLDNSTATIHRSAGRLFAVSPGNTTVVARIYGGEGRMICTTYGHVKVGIPSSFELITQSDRLAVGSEMPIYPHILEGTLFSFYELCKDFKWSVANDEVLGFIGTENFLDEKNSLPNSSKKEETRSSYLGQDLGFIALLYGRSGGRTEVSISFSCDFKSSGSFLHTRSYNSSLSIWVVSNLPLSLGALTWILPPHYTSSDLLPSSSKSKILYSLLRQCGEHNEELHREAISIDGNRIVTTESDILGCIQAKDRLTGRIEVASCIRVAEVAQIRIITSPFSSRSIYLAVGSEIDLPISYHDDLGMPFREAYGAVTFSTESNYPDIITINGTGDGNGMIHLKALKNGRALVRISFNNNPPKSDYVMISVGAHLYPQNALLHIGARLNFSVEGLDDQMHGHWQSANESIVFVDRFSGKAEATGEGATEVIFEDSGIKLKTAVRVLKGTKVLVTAPKGTLTNAPFPANGYGFLVNFSGSDSHWHKYESPKKSLEFSYDCRVEPPYVGYVKPWKDLDAGASYCLFFPYSPEHLVHSMPGSKDMKRKLSIYVMASLKEANHISGSASALFIGGFSILEMDKLNLNEDSKRTTLNIVGNTDVEVHWHAKDQLLISPIHNKDFGIHGHAQYEVKVLRRDEKFKDKIIITLPANEQRVEIDVNYEGGGGREMTRIFASNYYTVTSMLVCFAVLIVTVGLYIIYLDRPGRRRTTPPLTGATHNTSTPNNTPNNNNRSTPRPSSSNNSATMNDQSPRTPPPFIEYVRRTIDETPYYRRDGRRFDLQNTF